MTSLWNGKNARKRNLAEIERKRCGEAELNTGSFSGFLPCANTKPDLSFIFYLTS